ncbi:MAG: hypothetical protein JWP87_1561, partial [Labilithrix sp.]|nr:hypothetical protein [Labilithrix sp.]
MDLALLAQGVPGKEGWTHGTHAAVRVNYIVGCDGAHSA